MKKYEADQSGAIRSERRGSEQKERFRERTAEQEEQIRVKRAEGAVRNDQSEEEQAGQIRESTEREQVEAAASVVVVLQGRQEGGG